MKYSLLILSIFATTAYATPQFNQYTEQAAAAPLYGNVNVHEGVTNFEGGDINFNAKRNPVNSAFAPSVTNFQSCPIVSPDSKGLSLPFVSLSGTTGTTLNPICYALQREQYDVADKMMCAASKEYAKANLSCSQ